MAALATVFEVLLLAAALLLLVPLTVLAVQVGAAMRQRGTVPAANPPGPADRLPLAVLMPAHDEAGGIAAVIAALKPGLRPGDRLLVVADNCTDDTSAIARAAGAEVVERFDPLRRGKGYALDFGVRHLAAQPPAIVVIVDADCIVEPGALDRLAWQCAADDRPIQALYLMNAPSGAGTRLRIAEFAWILKNHVRALGYRQLGLPCQLMGTGMAFPWRLIRGAPLASGHIVEDLQLGLDLAAAGTPPAFCPSARVTSTFPSRIEGIETQRTRWEHGHLGVIAKVGPRLLWQAFRRRDGRLFAMTLDLCVPPLAALALALAAFGVAAAILAVAGPWLPLAVAGILIALLAAVVGLAWHRFGREAVDFNELLMAPLYAIRKVPMYARMLGRRQLQWVRTRRDDRPG